MQYSIFLSLFLLTGMIASAADSALTPVFQDDVHQFTGVAVSKSGRMFVNYPRWQTPHEYDLVEVISNRVQPFPNLTWNSWSKGQSGSNKWVCVQAVYVDDADDLWGVDPAAPGMKSVQADGAKLVQIDLRDNRVAHIFNLTSVVGKKSYLNDVRIDTQARIAYLTESAHGGLVVVDLTSGRARLVLAHTKFVKSDPRQKLIIDGVEVRRRGKPMRVNSDGIALSPDRQWLYFKPLSDTKLYRVRTEYLRDASLSRHDLETKVEDLGPNFTTCDGMIFDRKGNLYMGDLSHDGLMRVTPDMKSEVIARDPRLLWPDTFSWFPDGALCVTCSQIQNMPWCHDGKSTRTTPYTIYKLNVQ